MIEIRLLSAQGEELCRAQHEKEARMCVLRAYEEGDRFEICADSEHLMVQMDTALAPAEVYARGGRMTWTVPSGRNRDAYAPGIFELPRHIVIVRQMTDEEIHQVRCISRNPADLRGHTDFFPHCTANVETRDEACFAARNVIDGYLFNQGHGEWPWQSWGIGIRQDACCRIDFGREVEASCVALVLRADFPHDAWWQRVRLRLSDGSSYTMSLEKTGERQFMDIGRHVIRWMELDQLEKADDPSPFPSLSQWEVYGCDR